MLLPVGPKWLAILLYLGLGLFLADAVVSLMDDLLMLFLQLHALTGFRVLVNLLTTLISIVIYVLMALTPIIPKRLFVPLALFGPLTFLAALPFMIYHYQQTQAIALIISFLQLLFGLWVLCRLQGGLKFNWALARKRLPVWRFSWANLIAFVLSNILVLLPAVGVYLFVCAGLALNHFSAGFMTLHPGGLSVQVRTYVRSDGKTIQLFPMSHIADGDFYQKVAGSFPTKSVILMEGVTDRHNLITNQISYKRMAKSLGLAEQHEKFKPVQGEVVDADVDVSQFSKDTLDLLNLVMLFHSQGANLGNIQPLLQYSPSPRIQDELLDDLLRKRNQHLLEQVQAYLPKSDYLMLPWGAAHMPGIAGGIQKYGFRLVQSQDYQVIRFHF